MLDAKSDPNVPGGEPPTTAVSVAEPVEPPRGPTAAFSLSDEADLLFLYGAAQAALERSTASGQIDHLARYSPSQIEAAGHEYGRPSPEDVYSTDGVHVIGRRSGITAEITAEVRAPSGFTPDAYASERFARVSRRRLALGQRPDGARHEVVLRTYFGDPGNRWAKIEIDATDPRTTDKALRSMRGHGRIASLYALTTAGQQLLAWSTEQDKKAKRADLGLAEQARMENEIAASARSDVRKALVMRAARQARELLGWAWEAWRATG